MKLKQAKYFYLLILLSIFNVNLFAQVEYTSTQEMQVGAQKLFSEGNYVEAFPLYSQLLSLDNTNPELNYRFGVCLLYADRSDTYAPIKYLKKAMNQVADPDIYYHLAYAYHINYYFPAAISLYKEYQQKTGKKENKSFEVDRKIEMCQNGMKMMHSVKDLFVLEKSEVSRNEFFRSYDLHDFGSRIIKKPEEFLTKEDKKKGQGSFVFFNPKAKNLYYSAYSSANRKQKDIFFRRKLPEGGWGNAQKLPETINTPYDDDYPVLMPDGKTLFFSSKGHNTIGGFDIFKAVFNPQTNTWSEPENINFPFNTPLDDILFISDTLESTAWFASVRNSIEDKINVYKVGIIKRPKGSADLAAIYAKNQELTEEDMRQIKQRARLDVNISKNEYEEIPVPVVVPVAQENQEKQGDNLISHELEMKKKEQVIIDSAKMLVEQLEASMSTFYHAKQSAIALADKKRVEAADLRDNIKRNMSFASQTAEKNTLHRLIAESNKAMLNAEKLDYEAAELDSFANRTGNNISEQQATLTDLTKQYGDTEAAAIQGDLEMATNQIDKMNEKLAALPQASELMKEYDAAQGGLLNMQYPTSLQEPDKFVAFVLSNNQDKPSVQSIKSEYDEYIPETEEIVSETEADKFSSLPSKRIEQYAHELEVQASSLNIQIDEQEQEIDRVKQEFNQLPAEEKEDQVAYLNMLINEQSLSNRQVEMAHKLANNLRKDYQKIALSAEVPEKKIEEYQLMIDSAESVFNFEKKSFIDETMTLGTPITVASQKYQLNSNGQLEDLSQVEHQRIPSSQLQFTEEGSQMIESQMTMMMSRLRNQSKQNSFATRKVQNNIVKLTSEAQLAFNQANTLIATAKNTNAQEKELAVAQANKQFNEAFQKIKEANKLKEISQEMINAQEDSRKIINQISIDNEALLNAIEKSNWSEVETLYLKSEKASNNHAAIIDFSSELDLETGALIKGDETKNNPIKAYQIANNGSLIKSFGDASTDWDYIENFSKDVLDNSTEQNLVLAPDIQNHFSQNTYIESFKPSTDFNGDNIAMKESSVPSELAKSDNSLVQNTLLQTQNLKNEAGRIIKKRNALNEYYQETIKKSAKLELQINEALAKDVITKQDLDKVNELSKESKLLLYKSAKTADLINQYDSKLIKVTAGISKSIRIAELVSRFSSERKTDDAVLLNVQLQHEVSNIQKEKIDDSNFNYIVNNMFVSTPEIINDESSQEFILEDGIVHRSNQKELMSLFQESSQHKAVNLAAAPLLIAVPITAEIAVSTNNVLSDSKSTKQYEPNNNDSNRNIDAIQGQSKQNNNLNSEISPNENIGVSMTDEKNTSTDSTAIVNQDASRIANNKSKPKEATAFLMDQDSTNRNITSPNSETIDAIIEQPMDVQSFAVDNYKNPKEYRTALSELNLYSQAHLNNISQVSDALIILADQKLGLSNKKSLEAELAKDVDTKKLALKESKQYLYEALAIKELVSNYDDFVKDETAKQEVVTNATFNIEKQLKENNLEESKQLFKEMQAKVQQFGEEGSLVLEEKQEQMLQMKNSLDHKMDSAYALSQELANKSVEQLSEAAEIRTEAEGKRNAFKRRELLKQAKDKEIKATQIQNNSEKALAFGNDYYQQKQMLIALESINSELNEIIAKRSTLNPALANKNSVFDGIESREREVIAGQLSTATQINPVSSSPQQITKTQTNNAKDMPNLSGKVDDIHVYERESFKAQMISEELELMKREIALLSQTKKSNLSDKEIYVLQNKMKILRLKTDSLEYQANKAFEYANSILNTLSAEDQSLAKEKGRDFNDYLTDLKDRIEILLSEASSLKQRAQRSNNLNTRVDLFDQAKDKEEVAMYLILEEFEVIAQKNKTRYRKNQLILQQMLMESASLQERELMQNIFAQIDSYFDKAQKKRKKANTVGISFNMRKILLQDAYSLEMKALDLQLQAKTMLEKKDVSAMLAYQKDVSAKENIAQNKAETLITGEEQYKNETQANFAKQNEQTNQEIQIIKPKKNHSKAEQEIPFTAPDKGTVYKVQFSALQVIKPISFFKGISEISAQRVPNSTFIRYFSGSFTSLDAAMIRRNSVRSSGYPDAFIKSWNNGEEVSLLSLSDNKQNANVNLSAGTASQSIVNNIDFSATNISSLQGVYYSVQVGVYSRPRTSAMIHGVSPLYHKRMKNGYWIYYSGIYKTIADATARKDEIVNSGVNDAFIVAFSNGKTVSFTQARQDLAQGNETPPEEDIVILEDASLQIDSQWNISQTTKTNLATNNKNITFKIQVGVYSNRVNLTWISSQLEDGLQIDSYQNNKEKYVFTVGEFKSIQDARSQLESVKDIVPDAFIVGFKDGQKIYVSQ